MASLDQNKFLEDILTIDQDHQLFKEGVIRYKSQSLKRRLQLDQLLAEFQLQRYLKQDAYEFDDL
jgi:hypothetical protein